MKHMHEIFQNLINECASMCKRCLWITHEWAITQLFCIDSQVSLMINQTANTIN